MAPSLLERILEFAGRYRMFSPGDPVGAAVSGGADSVFLLRCLRELAPRLGIRLAVLHLNHKLRGDESEADAGFVRSLATDRGLPFYYREADVGSRPGNLEEAGREARHEFFRDLIAGGTVRRVATGHTRDDQAETVLFRLLRGSGTAGLAGILPVTGEELVRPLLEVSREEVETALRASGAGWREDSSNRTAAFSRNRIRHGLLPLLARDWNPSIAATLAAVAAVARDEEEYWRVKIDDLFRTLATRRQGAVLLPVRWVAELPAAASRRLIRKAFTVVRGDLRQIEFEHVELAMRLFASGEGDGRFQAPGVDVFRSFDWVRLAAPALPGEPRNWSVEVAVPGSYPLPDGSSISLRIVSSGSNSEAKRYNGGDTDLNYEGVTGTLRLRNWRPGDEYRPPGVSAPRKLKLLFQDKRVPLWERRNWPVITCEDRIVWSRLFGPAEEVRAGEGTRSILRVVEDFPEPVESGDRP